MINKFIDAGDKGIQQYCIQYRMTNALQAVRGSAIHQLWAQELCKTILASEKLQRPF